MADFVILLVEDDWFQREVMADILRDEGFKVIELDTAEAAELILSSPGTEVQALITDHNLPGTMSGAALAEFARRRRPHMNIIVISGTRVEAIPANTKFLQKPFAPERLLEAIRR